MLKVAEHMLDPMPLAHLHYLLFQTAENCVLCDLHVHDTPSSPQGWQAARAQNIVPSSWPARQHAPCAMTHATLPEDNRRFAAAIQVGAVLMPTAKEGSHKATPAGWVQLHGLQQTAVPGRWWSMLVKVLEKQGRLHIGGLDLLHSTDRQASTVNAHRLRTFRPRLSLLPHSYFLNTKYALSHLIRLAVAMGSVVCTLLDAAACACCDTSKRSETGQSQNHYAG